jgi:hypothetical protein
MKTSDSQTYLQQQLLDADAGDASLRAGYERKRNAMLETRLTAGKKLAFITLCAFNFVVIGLVITLLLTEPLPRRAMIPLILGVGFSLAWLVYFIAMIRRGAIRRRTDPPLAAGMGFFFAMAMCIVLLLSGVETSAVMLLSILLLIPAGLNVIRVQIDQAEMRTQERIIELQYRLAVLSERIGGDDDTAGSAVPR